MKKHLSVLLILLALCLINLPTLSQDCAYSWLPQNSGTKVSLYTCKAVNELVCWAAGDDATVLRTTDGGINWLNANPHPGIIIGEVRNMEALDESTALVTTESQASTAVYKTTDGGNSWNEVYANTEGFIKGIRMLDPVNGIAIGNPISDIWNVLLTTDGGNTWQPSPTVLQLTKFTRQSTILSRYLCRIFTGEQVLHPFSVLQMEELHTMNMKQRVRAFTFFRSLLIPVASVWQQAQK